jgi:hypothetical protein
VVVEMAAEEPCEAAAAHFRAMTMKMKAVEAHLKHLKLAEAAAVGEAFLWQISQI